MKFDFLEKRQGMNFCSGVARSLHRRKVEEVFVYPYLMEEFRPDLIKEYIGQLTCQNLVVLAEAKAFEEECKEVEPIYQSKYCVQPLGTITPKPCVASLPATNYFIPSDLTVLPLGTQKHPRKNYQS